MNKSDLTRDYFMLKGSLAKKGYDWWWHSFTGYNKKTGAEKTFFVEYFLCNPKKAQAEPVIVWNNQELQKKKVKPSYLMVKVGHWGKTKGQYHRFIAWKDVEIAKDQLYLKAFDNLLTETRIKGSVEVTKEDLVSHPEWMCDSGKMSWDLEVKKEIAYNVGYGASKFFRTLNAFEMFWHAEGMKTSYSGTITLNGEEYEVIKEKSYGYADKNWGQDFTSPWVWLSSSNLVSNITGKKLTNSVFEIGGGRPKIFGIALNRKLLGQIYYEGREFEFNFSKFWTGSKTSFKALETEDKIIWDVTQTTRKAKLVCHIECLKSEMLLINYEAPNGTKRHNSLWNSGNGYGNIKLYERVKNEYRLLDDMSAKNVGSEYGEYDK